MWEGLDGLLHARKAGSPWSEVDVRHWVTRYLAAELKSDEVYCESAHAGQLVVRVGTALFKQEVLLLEYDLKRLLSEQGQWRLTELVVRY